MKYEDKNYIQKGKEKTGENRVRVCEHESEGFERVVLVFLSLGIVQRQRTKAARESKT